LEWVGDEVAPHPRDELELTERIGRDAGEDGHDGGGGHTRLPENLRRTCVGGRYLGGKDRRATEGKDGRRWRKVTAGGGYARRWPTTILESIGLFSEDSGNCRGGIS
jgi:hypothetical protein